MLQNIQQSAPTRKYSPKLSTPTEVVALARLQVQRFISFCIGKLDPIPLWRLGLIGVLIKPFILVFDFLVNMSKLMSLCHEKIDTFAGLKCSSKDMFEMVVPLKFKPKPLKVFYGFDWVRQDILSFM